MYQSFIVDLCGMNEGKQPQFYSIYETELNAMYQLLYTRCDASDPANFKANRSADNAF